MVENPVKIFRDDHREVRDNLLELASAIETKDLQRAGEILDKLNKLLGPHFRFEEEALYPAIRGFLGEYVDSLLNEHDGAINAAKDLANLIQNREINDETARTAADRTRALLVHVSNCDGIAILAERLDKDEIEDLGKKFDKIREEGIPLLDWADTIRNKRGS